ncbi:metallophosphoesterase [Bosea sp. 47.2.35]|uniref:metallophosphoesterase n=1 Tax=Bosea sp. 47.2.35 TaxID=2969304 RepID=UPI002150684B|nr:metallophosphoesterase [Bosea sp. 47.2.35]MCR4521675.1 metallophosphoesterase [Bosea sp. 47.2.35]
MKIWILSDLHLELQEPIPLPVPHDADVCVLAGDIDRPIDAAIRWAAFHVASEIPVVYVPGNHEFYRDSYLGGLVRGCAFAEKHPNVHMLHDASVVIEGVRFVGGTLWTDYALNAERVTGAGRDRDIAYAMRNASGLLNDHRVIDRTDDPPITGRSRDNNWMPADARQAHFATRRFLEATLSEEFDGPTVVVTHHAPHPWSVHPRYYIPQPNPLNPAFVSDLSDMILEHQPDLWVHGHVHDSFDYVVEGSHTRVICNPRGYGSENPAFEPDLVIEVST